MEGACISRRSASSPALPRRDLKATAEVPAAPLCKGCRRLEVRRGGNRTPDTQTPTIRVLRAIRGPSPVDMDHGFHGEYGFLGITVRKEKRAREDPDDARRATCVQRGGIPRSAGSAIRLEQFDRLIFEADSLSWRLGNREWNMSDTRVFSSATLTRDVTASVVVFLVALPLCLGIALASGAPLFAGLLAGIVGGVVVGAVSGSHVSVSGPAAGLTSIVAAQVALLGPLRCFSWRSSSRARSRSRWGSRGRLHRRVFSVECHQRSLGGDRRYPDPETDSPPVRARYGSGRRDVVSAARSRDDFL